MANMIESVLVTQDGLTRMNVMVTCDAVFAGTDIVCSNGTEMYTKQCPSTAPYTVVFNGLLADEWIITGEYAGDPYYVVVEIPSYKTASLTVQ